MTQDESFAKLVQSISTSKSNKAKDTGIKKSLKGTKQSFTVGDITFSSSSDESDQANKKRKLTDDRIPDTQTMVGQQQKLDLSPLQMENVLKVNRKGRDRLSLKRKARDAVGHSSYCEINTSSENDFVDSNKDITNDALLSSQLLEEDMNSESQLHTAVSAGNTKKFKPCCIV